MFATTLLSILAAYLSTWLLLKRLEKSGGVNKLIFCTVGVLSSILIPISVYTFIDFFFFAVNGSAVPGIISTGFWIGIIVPLVMTQKFKPAEKVIPSTPDLLLAAADGDTTLIETLLAEGASVDTLGPNGETALMLAIRNGKRDVVELLLANGADVHVKTPKGSTALSVAKHFKQTEIEGLLQGLLSAKH